VGAATIIITRPGNSKVCSTVPELDVLDGAHIRLADQQSRIVGREDVDSAPALPPRFGLVWA
jgi:hypothetical protein